MERKPEVVILGAGYVGLTLGLLIASRKIPVLLLDTDAGKVERLQRGRSTIYESGIQELLQQALASGTIQFSSHPPAEGANLWIVAVPYLPREFAGGGEGRYLECLSSIRGNGSTPPVVMIRSTLPVGFTRSKILPRLAERLDGTLDQGFFITVCPERTVTGVALRELAGTPQLVGGSPASVAQTLPFFQRCGISCIPLESFEAAELGKSFCNLSRLAQFNLSNFFGLCCEQFGINAQELLQALSTHYPRLQLPIPGPGVGGSCLPKDSLVLFDGLTDAVLGNLPEESSAREVWSMPRQQYLLNEQIISNAAQAVLEFTAPGLPILALGIAFKGVPRTDDTRNSVGLKIVQALQRNQRDVRVHDLTVPESSVKALGLQPASLPLDLNAYSALLLLNNDPGTLDLLSSALSPKASGSIGLYDPWRLILSDNPTVFAQSVPLSRLIEQLRPRDTFEAALKR